MYQCIILEIKIHDTHHTSYMFTHMYSKNQYGTIILFQLL